MRARLDGFLLDSFLFEFFVERFGEDSSRTGVPEAVRKPHTEANCRVKRCVRRSKLGKAISNANRANDRRAAAPARDAMMANRLLPAFAAVVL
jgi:hypothetical protein